MNLAHADIMDTGATTRRSGRRVRRTQKTLCRGCGQRPAKFRRWTSWTTVRWDRNHTLCFRCFRAATNALRAGHLARCC